MCVLLKLSMGLTFRPCLIGEKCTRYMYKGLTQNCFTLVKDNIKRDLVLLRHRRCPTADGISLEKYFISALTISNKYNCIV